MTEQPQQQLKPCFHMKGLLDAWQRKRLPGFLAWYVRYHVTHCTRCREALQLFHALRERLRTLGATTAEQSDLSLSPERKTRLQAAIEEIDRQNAAPPSD